jgi:putative endonuclease
MLPDSKHILQKQLGTAGEHAVGQWLQNQGFTIITYNYRTNSGEIDLIASYNEIIAFVEVKVRTTHYFNSSQVIIPSKQQKIVTTAKNFCMKYKISHKILRFDVALLQPIGDTFEITYIPNAFTEKEDSARSF